MNKLTNDKRIFHLGLWQTRRGARWALCDLVRGLENEFTS